MGLSDAFEVHSTELPVNDVRYFGMTDIMILLVVQINADMVCAMSLCRAHQGGQLKAEMNCYIGWEHELIGNMRTCRNARRLST